ncbi:MAG: FG-GAP-like repeat-containing protein [Cyclobacteriaceae bacterium]|nr:VCBS repeat-containing protein [Cyclobacteriaceae bacterium]MCH8517899.1 FG-GAP-like repeat-containing protein [Cyclobacteriaceae bacterium]
MSQFHFLLLIACFILCLSTSASGQTPIITGFESLSNTPGGRMLIRGNNFGEGVNDNKVFFGSASAEILSATNNEIEVIIPAGAQIRNITVFNRTSKRFGVSSKKFQPTYIGDGSGFSPGNFQMVPDLNLNYPAGSAMYVELVDLNLSGLLDIVAVGNSSRDLYIYINNSSNGEVSFEPRITRTLPQNLQLVSFGDLTGDGYPEIIVSTFGGAGSLARQIYLFENQTEEGAFALSSDPVSITREEGDSRLSKVENIAQNGRNSLISVSNSNSRMLVFNNQDWGTGLSFGDSATEILLNTNTSGAFDRVILEDFNGNGSIDIIANFLNGPVLNFREGLGTLQFGEIKNRNLGSAILSLISADLNNNGASDLITINTPNRLNILPNESNPDNLQFSATPNSFNFANGIREIDVADFDGNNRADIIISFTNTNLGFLNNISQNNQLSFNQFNTNTAFSGRIVRTGDLNGDGKSDYLLVETASESIRIFQNERSDDFKILNETSNGNLTACLGFDFILEATPGPYYEYQWFRNGDPIPDATRQFYNLINENEVGLTVYSVEITDPSGRFNGGTDEITVEILETTAPDNASVSFNTPLCEGDALELSFDTIEDATYFWEGPAGFTSTEQNPTIENVSEVNKGNYRLTLSIGQCPGIIFEAFVEINFNPQLEIATQNDITAVCETPLEASVSEVEGFSYKWLLEGSEVGTGNVIEIIDAGEYQVIYTSPAGCEFLTAPITIEQISIPKPSFESPNVFCVEEPISLDLLLEEEPFENFDLVVNWDFGDGNSASGTNVNHTYELLGEYTIRVEVFYNQDGSCKGVFEKSIEAVLPPSAPEIQSETETFDFCPDDDLLIFIEGDFRNINWNTGDTTAEIVVSQAGTYTVTVITNSFCILESSVTVRQAQTPNIEVSSSPVRAGIEEPIQFTASGGVEYEWFPPEFFDNPNIPNPIGIFAENTTIELTVINETGCIETKELFIELDRTVNVTAPKVFTPNSDGIDDVFVIENIERFPECEVRIIDRQGKVIFQEQPYNNNWDGTYRGSPVVEGVYFYVIVCNGVRESSGSITILR